MQFDIFSTEPAVSNTDTVSTSSEPSIPPTIGEKFAKLWKDAVAAVDAWATDLARLSSVEQTILHCEEYMAAIKPLDDYDTRKLKEKIADRIRDRIKRYAEQYFAPPGGKLVISNDDLSDEFPEIDRDNFDNFDPAAFWACLEKKYGGDAGQEAAWKQAAQAIVESFSLRQSSPMEQKGGYTVLTRSVWLDDHYKKWNKQNRPSHSSQQCIVECLKALVGFATWADRYALRSDLNELVNMVWTHGYCIESRKQYACGDKGEIVVVTFAKSFEYRIREDVATQLNLFLGTYATLRD
jgi:hypothetical protein